VLQRGAGRRAVSRHRDDARSRRGVRAAALRVGEYGVAQAVVCVRAHAGRLCRRKNRGETLPTVQIGLAMCMRAMPAATGIAR
jgi:hypothetical protein